MRCIHGARQHAGGRTGSIVNITSVEGRLAIPNQVAYSSSKWAWSALEKPWPTSKRFWSAGI